MWDFRGVWSKAKGTTAATGAGASELPILRQGPAHRMVFFYPGEEGTYVENVEVTLYVNGIVHFKAGPEESTTHLKNCEILWTSEQASQKLPVDDRTSKVRLLKPGASRKDSDSEVQADSPAGRTTKVRDHEDQPEDEV